MPLQIPDMSIAAQVKVPDAFQSINSMLNMQSNQLALQKARATYDADVSQRQSESSSAGSAATVNAANVQPLIDQQAANTSTAQTQAGSTALAFQQQKLGAIAGRLTSLITDPQVLAAEHNPSSVNVDSLVGKLKAYGYQQADEMGIPKAQADQLIQPYIDQATNDPAGLGGFLRGKLMQTLDPAQRAASMNPSGVSVGNGQQTSVINTNQFSPNPWQPIPGTTQQQQLPPTTTKFNPATNSGGYVGPQAAPGAWVGQQPVGNFTGNPSQIENKINGPLAKGATEEDRAGALLALHNQMGGTFQGGSKPDIQSGPALGQQTTQEGIAGTVQKDWADTGTKASSAAQNIGVLQNIKQYAPGAATGVTGARESLVAGLAGRLGMTPGELVKTNTDLLAKNSAMLQLAGGSTDMARTLAEAANPNSHMTPEAIMHAADQVIAQQKMAVNKQNMLLPYVGNPDAYNSVLSHFNKISDPRGLQYDGMTTAEKSAMKSAMSPAERAAFGQTLDAQHAAGWR